MIHSREPQGRLHFLIDVLRGAEDVPVAGFEPGLAGVVTFKTAIAEANRGGGSLHYRGVDAEDLIGKTSFGTA